MQVTLKGGPANGEVVTVSGGVFKISLDYVRLGGGYSTLEYTMDETDNSYFIFVEEKVLTITAYN